MHNKQYLYHISNENDWLEKLSTPTLYVSMYDVKEKIIITQENNDDATL